MARSTLLDMMEPYAAFTHQVSLGIALGRAWQAASANESVVMGRVQRVIELLEEGRLSEAADQARKVVDVTKEDLQQCEVLAYVASTSEALHRGEAGAAEALKDMRRLASEIRTTSLPGFEGLADAAALNDAQIDGMVQAMRQLGDADLVAAERSLRARVQARIRAFHAYVILSAARRRGAAFPSVSAASTEIGKRSLELRDAARTAASGAPEADAGWYVALAAAIATFEEDWLTEVGDACVALLVEGTRSDATKSQRREAALAYDAVRLGLAWLAGCYALLIAWARDDASTLRRWSSTAALPLDSGLLDLPRTDLAAVAAMQHPAGSTVEVAGVVTEARSEAQGGRIRTIARLDDTLTIYFPFSAVDGFGMLPGVWCQARGEILDEAKGGHPAPTLSVRRRPLGNAAEHGFSEHLAFEGRWAFDHLRSGIDATAGRLAHDARTANEAADWN